MKCALSPYVLITSALFSPSLQAMTCAQFNSLGHEAHTLDEVISSAATHSQVDEFKKIISDHAGTIAGFRLFLKRRKALNLIIEKNMLVDYMRDSLAFTRSACFMRPSEPMKEVAIEQFDFMLDALAKRL